MNNELKPCPCCGGPAGRHVHAIGEPEATTGAHNAIECRKCGLNTGAWKPLAAAITAWNTRALERAEPKESVWIPVSERLPEEYATVAMSEDGHTAISGFINDEGKWFSHARGIVEAPNLWFLLPESSAIQNAADRVTK